MKKNAPLCTEKKIAKIFFAENSRSRSFQQKNFFQKMMRHFPKLFNSKEYLNFYESY